MKILEVKVKIFEVKVVELIELHFRIVLSNNKILNGAKNCDGLIVSELILIFFLIE